MVVVDGVVPCTVDSRPALCRTRPDRTVEAGHLFRAVASYLLGPGRSLTGAKVAPRRGTIRPGLPGDGRSAV